MGKKQALIALTALVASVAWTAGVKTVAEQMAEGARYFLSALDPGKRAQATFAFDDAERFNWHFIPRERKGLPYIGLTSGQRRLADRLVGSALSQSGIEKAFGVMFLDQVLFERERRDIRNPDRYFLTVFGEPAADSAWGWRLEGHHLSVNVTLDKGEVVSTSPLFFGANPAIVEDGPQAGLEILADEQTLARRLLASITGAAREKVIIDSQAPRDIITSNSRRAEPGNPRGLKLADMTDEQADLLMNLVGIYANRMRLELAKAEMLRITEAGVGEIHFAWAGSTEPGRPHYYRIHGPTFLVEYDNTQNDANHIRSVWRDLTGGDFGEDLLAEHYAAAHSR
jgi:Protein of unknown function (DUF3500)